MKRRVIAIAMVVAVGLCLGGIAVAQRGPGGGGQGRGPRMFDPKTVETIGGEVVSVEKVPSRRGAAGGGIHLTLKTDKESIAVHLGPAWYMEKQAVMIEPKDHIEVRGSRVTFQGKPAIVAAEVKKGDQALKLRDENGLPAWRGQRPPRR